MPLLAFSRRVTHFLAHAGNPSSWITMIGEEDGLAFGGYFEMGVGWIRFDGVGFGGFAFEDLGEERK
jgi:hypothetical protein